MSKPIKITKDERLKLQKVNLEAQGKIIQHLREKIEQYRSWLFDDEYYSTFETRGKFEEIFGPLRKQ
jgi:hypothetical protein